jgi:hypothetical protein
MQSVLVALQGAASWIYAHPLLFAAGLFAAITALNGALRKNGKAPWLVGWLDVLVDFVSILSRRDSAGTWKLPLRPSKPVMNGVHVEREPGGPSLRALLPLLFVAATLASACASGVDGLRQAEANAAMILATSYRGLRIVDKGKLAAIREQARTGCATKEELPPCKGDPAGAEHALGAWLGDHELASKVLDQAADVVIHAHETSERIAAGVAVARSVLDLLTVELLALVPKVIAALARFGVKIGGAQ